MNVRSILLVVGFLPVPATAECQSPDLRDVVYGHVDGMAMVYDVSLPRGPANGAGVVFVISGGFLSTIEQQELIQPVADPLLDAGFTIFHLRHPSTPRYMAPEIYDAVRLGTEHVLAHASDLDVDPGRVGVMGMSTGGLLALLLALDRRTNSRRLQPMLAALGVTSDLVIVDAGHELFAGGE